MRHYRIWFNDGTNIDVKDYVFYGGEYSFIVVEKANVIKDPWKYFDEGIVKISFSIFTVSRIEVVEDGE